MSNISNLSDNSNSRTTSWYGAVDSNITYSMVVGRSQATLDSSGTWVEALSRQLALTKTGLFARRDAPNANQCFIGECFQV